MRSRAFWAQECKLTCLGGSERGTCACRCPNDCVAQHDPGFGAARQRAKDAMGRHLMNAIAGSPAHETLSARRTLERDERDRFKQPESLKSFRADCAFYDAVRLYRVASRVGGFDDEIMQEWKRNLESRTDSTLTFAWHMAHMDRQVSRDR